MFVRVQCMNDVSLLCISPPVEKECIFQSVSLCVSEFVYESICYTCRSLEKCSLCVCVTLYEYESCP